MSSGVIQPSGSDYGDLPRVRHPLAKEPHHPLPKEDFDAQGNLTLTAITRRLSHVFGVINGADESANGALVKAQEELEAWKAEKAKANEPAPTQAQVIEKLQMTFKWALARQELHKKSERKDLLAGRTDVDTEEIQVEDREGKVFGRRLKARWEFTKERIRDVLDPSIADNELLDFLHDGEGNDSGGQGYVQHHPKRKLVSKHMHAEKSQAKDENGFNRKDREVTSLKHLHRTDPTIAPKPLGEGTMVLPPEPSTKESRKEQIIFMEQAPGKPLDKIKMDLRSLSIEQKSTLSVQLIDLVQRMHAAGLLHRDIKPPNMMMDTEQAVVTLLDFGLARVRHNDADFSKSLPFDATFTSENVVVGSPLYIAPLQALDSRIIDPRNDLYSLGILLYEMLTETSVRTLPKIELQPVEGESEKDKAKRRRNKMIEAQTALLNQVRAPGFVDELPALYGDVRRPDGTIAEKLPPEIAQGIEILVGWRKVDVPQEQISTNPLTKKEESPIIADTVDVAVAPSETPVEAEESTNDKLTADIQLNPVSNTVDFVPGAQKFESPEERRAWREAEYMTKEAIAYFEKVAHGQGHNRALAAKRKAESLLSGLASFVIKPWVVVAEVLGLFAAVSAVGGYMMNRKVEDPSEVIVREAEEPDPDFFNVSSQKTYADGHKDLSLLMPGKMNIPPIHMKSAQNFWRTGPNGQRILAGFTTAGSPEFSETLFGFPRSKEDADNDRYFHVIGNDHPTDPSTFTWSSGVRFFRPSGQKTRAGYGTGQMRNHFPKDFPFVKYTQDSSEWIQGMMTDPEFQAFIKSVVLDDLTTDKMNAQIFIDAGVDALPENRNMEIFKGNIKSFQMTVDKTRQLQKQGKMLPQKKKISMLIPPGMQNQFADRNESVSTPRRNLTDVQVREYRNRKNRA